MLRPSLTTVELEKSLLREKPSLLTDAVLTVAKTHQTLQNSTVTVMQNHGHNHCLSQAQSLCASGYTVAKGHQTLQDSTPSAPV